uniref:Uncharacterized protein n=1 Tax=Opuntia streptacantha TaxID=393608 RepID=A0A7C8YRM1_OPUST
MQNSIFIQNSQVSEYIVIRHQQNPSDYSNPDDRFIHSTLITKEKERNSRSINQSINHEHKSIRRHYWNLHHHVHESNNHRHGSYPNWVDPHHHCRPHQRASPCAKYSISWNSSCS